MIVVLGIFNDNKFYFEKMMTKFKAINHLIEADLFIK